jgi:hypothetical protein
VTFTVIDLSEANALNITLTLLICDDCKFAKEPDGFQQLPGDDRNTHRTLKTASLRIAEFASTMTVDIIPPPRALSFTMGIEYRCDTCAVVQTPMIGTVHVRRDFLRIR